MIFLWIFLPVTFLGSKLIVRFTKRDRRIRVLNLFYLICSLIFYAWGGIYYLLIILASIAVNFAGGYLVNPKTHSKKQAKIALIGILSLNLLNLFVFKYFNMAVIVLEAMMANGGIKGLLHAILYMEGTGALGLPEIILPIGISFFTFQSMSYVIDVYRGTVSIQTSLLDFALYVAFFPQLIAGPIVRYKDIAGQLRKRRRTRSMVIEGQKRFVFGLAKKVLLANTFGAIADGIWDLEIAKLGGPLAWLGMISYTIQIYYDFSGYSDMAIGIGRILGFTFAENFNEPYTATSVQDFWRRWHMSLSGWFREYVYIPLGGSREGLTRTCLNTLIVFTLTGIWHGANFTFLAWGLFYAILLIAERLFLGRLLKKNPLKWINWLYTMLVVMAAWVFFRSDNISQALTFLSQLFHGISSSYSVFSYLSLKAILLFFAAVFFSGWGQRLFRRFSPVSAEDLSKEPIFSYIELAVELLLIFFCILELADGSYNAFIYFQF